ncbi:hypothetical protein GBAR_LOCUS1149 [Geodia barretti]|uniref:Uncharacterized protein n=1 Tax=Geodia barretti TaxID=519541 RepID=A0AA35QW44_GEOBA|nr:hypothetical protein GBAR_LOCUS1149 [Geodia barretti]
MRHRLRARNENPDSPITMLCDSANRMSSTNMVNTPSLSTMLALCGVFFKWSKCTTVLSRHLYRPPNQWVRI